MRATALAFAVIILALGAATASAQDRQFDRFRVVLPSGALVEGSHGVLDGAALTWTASDGTTKRVPRAEIQALEITNGNKAKKWALLGALIGASAGLALLQADSQLEGTFGAYHESQTARFSVIAAGLTVGGAGLGALFGASRKTWSPVSVRAGAVVRSTETRGVQVAAVVSCGF
jgi:hypothetical protein